ncbi:hypothetical protein DAEQUDRAFT_68102 [Daedalea quercina L-15889]|uniref:Uncharacterized protein n=1 Tax=Daedalea quercina L-15889 TaxID=1314783 RepID=A0A165L7J4_9APHY|nr:hypothetical protein DAEQUDRAFT_68102 [Daedalea quercina L-15889]
MYATKNSGGVNPHHSNAAASSRFEPHVSSVEAVTQDMMQAAIAGHVEVAPANIDPAFLMQEASIFPINKSNEVSNMNFMNSPPIALPPLAMAPNHFAPVTPVARSPLGTIVCRIGNCCRFMYPEKISEVKQHIYQFHQDLFNRRNSEGKVLCPWICEHRGTQGTCNTALTIDGLAKHIATVHLQSTRKPCRYGCGASLSRGDAELRHIKRDCPLREAARLQASG